MEGRVELLERWRRLLADNFDTAELDVINDVAEEQNTTRLEDLHG